MKKYNKFAVMLSGVCEQCGAEISYTSKNPKKFCSDNCRYAFHYKYDPEKERKRYLRKHPNARTQKEILEEAEKNKKAREELTEQRRIENLEKKKRKQVEENKKILGRIKKCKICDQLFLKSRSNQACCSDKCKIRLKRQENAIRKRYKGISIDKDISLIVLAEKCNQQCQICGLFVDWEDKIQTDKTIICGDMYPSIDHIYPISLGGLHSWDNVQLAHRKCNSLKSNII